MNHQGLSWALLAAGAVWAAELEPISTAEVCGSCHRAIHEAWKRSGHAAAMESRLFQDALAVAEEELGSGVRKQCLECHSPLAIRTGDLSLKTKVAWEGVTCDFCHSLTRVNWAGGNPVPLLKFSLVKTGPIRDAGAAVHGTAYSEVHTSSVACAPCHQYRNPEGLDALTTYSEWEGSRYAKEGIHCQSCHMGSVEGNVVDPRVAASAARVNLHEMPGGHSLEQLNKAIRAHALTSREGELLKISIEVTNAGAGHYVPTGSPMRQMILDVSLQVYGGQRFREQRYYRREVADRTGRRLEREHVALLRGAKVLSDTRLAPDEKRVETFSFPVPPGAKATLKASFHYYYSPMARTESQERLTFRRIQRLIQ